MGDDTFDFQGWDAIESSLREHGTTIGYAVLVEKVPQADGLKEETVDTFDFSDAGELASIMQELRQREADAEPSESWEPPDYDKDDIPDDDDDDDDGELREDEEKLPPVKGAPKASEGREQLIRDAMMLRCIARLRTAACDNILGERSKVFLVRIMAPKGGRCLSRKQFTLRNLGPVDEPRAPLVAAAPVQNANGTITPVYDAPIGLASLRAFQGLAHHYERFADMVHHHSKRTLTLESTTNDRLHAQLRDAYKQIDNLTGHIITLRAMTTEDDKAALKQMSSAERAKLANTAMDRFGDVAKAFFVSRGLSESAVKIVNLLGNHPKIKLLLERSDVVAVLSDPAELDAFAEGLYGIMDMSARGYADRKAAAQAANNNGAPAQ